SAPAADSGEVQTHETTQPEVSVADDQPEAAEPTPQPDLQAQPQEPAQPKPESVAEPAAEAPKPVEKPVPARGSERTDDGSMALALLEGRQPSQTAAAAAGSFVLQVAAYTTEADAQSRRDKLA